MIDKRLFKSIRFKWTAFIILMLVLNLIILRVLMFSGISDKQRKAYEELLTENSRLSNLYIRESFASKHVADDNLKDYLERESYNLASEIEKIVHLPVTLYNDRGEHLDNAFNQRESVKEKDLLNRALKDEIVYYRDGVNIIYFAPIHDSEKQIGVMQFMYSTESEKAFYDDSIHLFNNIAVVALLITATGSILYFSVVVKNIEKLRAGLRDIVAGKYLNVSILATGDELEELSRGIDYTSRKIDKEIELLKKEKQKLKQAVEKLKLLEKQQKSFIGDITHEFKTPLTVIKAQLDLIDLYKDDTVMANRARDIAYKEIERLDSMVLKTLHISSLEKYEFEDTRAQLEMQILIEDICQRMEGKAKKYNLSINREIEECTLCSDREQLTQILINLIDNGIKYNEIGGKIYVRGYKIDDNYVIEIEDTGIGIAEEHRERIFEPFYVVDKNRSKRYSGTGLGLSLVKKLVSQQGGEISVKSDQHGTIFRLYFPIKHGI